jgi:hypothetical protein
MFRDSSAGELNRLRLACRAVEVFSPHRTAYEVRVLEGIVWMTCDGSSRDIILRAGDSFFFPAGRLVIAEALVPGALIEIIPIGDQRTLGQRVANAVRLALFRFWRKPRENTSLSR